MDLDQIPKPGDRVKMATFDNLPDEQRILVAAAVANALDSLGGLPQASAEADQHTTLNESIEEWNVEPSAVLDADPEQILGTAKPLRRWHHQIATNGVAVATAETRDEYEKLGGEPKARLARLSASGSRARKISNAISKIDDEHVDGIVRMVSWPQYYLTFLWVCANPHRFAVVEGPPKLEIPTQLLDTYEFSTFLKKMRRVRGLIEPDERQMQLNDH